MHIAQTRCKVTPFGAFGLFFTGSACNIYIVPFVIFVLRSSEF